MDSGTAKLFELTLILLLLGAFAWREYRSLR